MIILENIEIKNFRNIKHSSLRGLKDLNIIVGPNNSGKTNVLVLIDLLRGLTVGSAYKFLCDTCNKFKEAKGEFGSLFFPVKSTDFYRKQQQNEIVVKLTFSEEGIEELIPGILDKMRALLRENPCNSAEDAITLRSVGPEGRLIAEHASPFIHEDIINEFRDWILYIPEDRIKGYKGINVDDYVREKGISGARMWKLIDLIKGIVDARIHDYNTYSLTLRREINGVDLEVSISEQGSGVRSLVSLAIDLLSSENSRIILIDEPELGLNPHSRQEFLKFLINLAKDYQRQIFIATHDPTFVNPNLFSRDEASVYLFSPIKDEFVKIDLYQNKEDPHIFAGFLPHTVSMKKIHLYVEGTSDAYVFMVFLDRFLRDYCPDNWYKVQGMIGIFHLGGDFWSHLLYTIPKKPYRCVVVLDGEKRRELPRIKEKYDSSKVNGPEFRIVKSPDDIQKTMWYDETHHPIYCLKREKIEDYLFDGPPPEDYDKVRDAPKAAEKLPDLPDEIKGLLSAILPKGVGCKGFPFAPITRIIKDARAP